MTASERANGTGGCVAANLFAGAGELRARCREFDWAASPLGPVDAWPQSLRTAVSLCLASGFPMLVMWGPELVQIYNDAFRSVLQAKHPAGLGQRARDCWPELWTMIGPMYRGVLDTGESIYLEDQLFTPERRGYVEEAYFTFSYSAIPDESHRPAGILATVFETTRHVLSRSEREHALDLANKRLRTAAVERTRLLDESEGARADAEASSASLRSTDAVLRFSLEIAALGAWDLDLVRGGSWRALRHDQIFGYPEGRAEWTYQDFLAHVHPEEKAIVDERFGGAVANNGAWDFVCRINRANDGAERWIAARGEVVTGAEGRAERMVGVVRDVTDQQLAERALRDSEARYRGLFESIDAGFCVIDMLSDSEGRSADYRFVETNPAFVQQTGLEGAVGRRIRELVPGMEAHWFERYGRVALTGQPIRFQSQSDALGRWFDVYAFRVGQPEEHQVAVLFTDVTAEKTAERERERLVRALEVERARLAKVFEEAPSYFAVVRGPEHVFELVNDAYYQLVGYRELLGKTLLEAMPEVAGQGFSELLENVRTTGTPWVGREVPALIARTHGAPPEEIFVDVTYLPLVESDGTIAGVIAHGSEVTQQVLARREVERARDRADQLQELTAALAATTTPEEVADVVVAQGVAATGAATGMLALRQANHDDGRPDEMVILRQQGVTASLAAAYARFPLMAPVPTAESVRTGDSFFLESGDAVRARFSEVPQIWESMGTQSLATVPLAIAGDTVGAMSFTFTAPRPFPGEDREFFLALGAQASQALERARLLAAERAARAEAEAANRAKSQFLATMSHELRTPLNAIGGYAELMEMGLHGPVTAEQRQALDRVQRSQRALLSVINEVLNYARLETGAVTYDLADVAVAEAVREAGVLVMPQLGAKGLAYATAGGDPGVAVRADRDKLQQILLNLLSNAIKFTEPRDGQQGRVDVSIEAVGYREAADRVKARGSVRISVSDTGVGIPADKLDAIFEPFVQVGRALNRPGEGTGLGLAISRDLARAMDGDLTVESEVGMGSTFTLTLPAA